MKIYLTHPITGLTYKQVMEYYDPVESYLTLRGYQVLSPMLGKDVLQGEESELNADGYEYNPITKGHAIFQRDKWMLHQCDIVYANLIGATQISIGSVMELAWGAISQKYVVLAMEEGNIHQHAFIREAADVIFDDHEDALTYFAKLAYGQ